MTIDIEKEYEGDIGLPYEEIIERVVLEALDYEKDNMGAADRSNDYGCRYEGFCAVR